MSWKDGHPFDCFCVQCRGGDPPTYAPTPPRQATGCEGHIVCSSCDHFYGLCHEVRNLLTNAQREIDALQEYIRDYKLSLENLKTEEQKKMELKGFRNSTNSKQTFENRDFISSDDLPKKGASSWKIDAVRESKKKTKGILCFVDLTCKKKKRVMSLRKGFTLDSFMDELGTNTDKWKGKSISLERGGSDGQYVNVSR